MTIPSAVSPALKVCLQLLGLWPGDSTSAIYLLSYLLSMLIIQYFQYVYILDHLKISELTNLVDCLSLALDYTLTIFKLIVLWIQRRVFHKIVTIMDNDWCECTKIDNHLHMMKIKADISHFVSNSLLSFNAIIAVPYLLGDYIMHSVFSSVNRNITLRQLPVKIQFPFDTQQSPTYDILVMALFLHVFIHAGILATVNGLIFTLVFHVSGQIDVICYEFTNISKNTLLHKSSVSLIGMLIKRHNRIISFSKNIETLFSLIALMQVIWNTLVICCLGLVIIVSVHNNTGVFVLVKTGVAYIAMTIETFVICFAGEYLSLKSKSIADATYKSLWYDMPLRQSKIILFIIMRSQKRLGIHAGKMLDMSFQTFTNVTFHILLWGMPHSTTPCTTKYSETDLYFLIFLKLLAMTIPSSISPALKVGLQLLGMWPGDSTSAIYLLSFLLNMLIVLYFQYVYIFDHLKISELTNLVDSLSVALNYTLTIFKVIILWIQRRVFHKILATMDHDWRKCINIDKHLHMMTIKAKVAHFISNTLLSMTASIGVTYLLGEYIIHSVFLSEDYNDTLRQLPIKVQFPFETQQSPTFEILLAVIFVNVMMNVCVVALINGLIFSLVFHASGQIDIMCYEFRNISNNKSTLLRESSVTSLGMLIERHNRIISFSNDIETLFSFIALMQIVWNTLVICCLGFVLIISIHTKAGIFVLIKTATAYLAIMMEAFVICFTGEYLSMKSKSITDATYKMPWYNMSLHQNKILLFMIMRSQKRLCITAANMMDMSFETFTIVRL
ncbi:uncharacterized protein LOC105193063 [Solenopsis invicta]|uniref:uncharacterized protein LOC105193063 n=1 Tax=Solenopsis invicta TaxID=13686 RepID=UPI00193E4D37|nr:uncharacterized protein LOC105193063 [Solenopsis invicta]